MKIFRRDVLTALLGSAFGGSAGYGYSSRDNRQNESQALMVKYEGLSQKYAKLSEQHSDLREQYHEFKRNSRRPPIPSVVIEKHATNKKLQSFPEFTAQGYSVPFASRRADTIWFHVSVPEERNDSNLLAVDIFDAVTDEMVHSINFDSFKVMPEVCQSFKDLGCEYSNTFQIEASTLPPDKFLKAVMRFESDLLSDPIYLCTLPTSSQTVKDMLVVLPTLTWHAYNKTGGHSFYSKREPAEVSLDRPFRLQGPNSPNAMEVYLKELQGLGAQYSVCTDLQLHDGSEFLTATKVLHFPIHAEYWTASMRGNFEEFLRNGGNAWISGGNTMWLQVRIEGRNVICHKTGWHIDPIEDKNLKTGSYRRSTAINDPEIRTTGMSYAFGGFPVKRSYASVAEIPTEFAVTQSEYDLSGGVQVMDSTHPVFQGTGLKTGDYFGVEANVISYEFDGVPLNSMMQPDREREPNIPENIKLLASALKAYFGRRETVCTVAEFRFENGGTVLNFGSHGWAFAISKDDLVRKIHMNAYRYITEK